MNDILNMKPGRELDALIAEKVMGWTAFSFIDPTIDYAVGVNGHRRNYAVDPEDGKSKPFPFYSTDMNDAWEVVEKMKKRGYDMTLRMFAGGNYQVIFGIEELSDNKGFAGTAPQAICKTALLAQIKSP